MDHSARKVLKAQKKYIQRNLILNDDILDTLENKDILTEEMVQHIKAERTVIEMITKLLFILTRRGPYAFQEFVEAIRPDFSFVSEALEEELAKEQENAILEPASELSNQDISRNNSEESLNNMYTEDTSYLCENCRHSPAMEMKSCQAEKTLSGTTDFMQRMMQESFGLWYTKLKSNMTGWNSRELSFKSPVPVTYDMVDQLLDELIDTVKGCYKVLGVKDNLKTHIINLKESKKKLKQDLKEKEEQKNKVSDNYIKMENKCRDLTDRIEMESRNTQKLHIEMTSLKEEMKDTLKEKNKEMYSLTKQLDAANQRTAKTQEILQEADNKIEVLQRRIERYEKETGKYDWQLTASGYQGKRSRSRDEYLEGRHANTFRNTPRNKKYNMNEDVPVQVSAISKQVKEVQHRSDEETEEFPAVEEPDGIKLKRSESFVQTLKKTNTSPVKTGDGAGSPSSDKENNDDSGGQKKNLGNDKETDELPGAQLDNLMIGNNTMNPTQNQEATDTRTGRSLSRRNSITVRPKRKIPSRREQVWFGTSGNSNQTIKSKVRRASMDTPRVLDTLVIGNNLNKN